MANFHVVIILVALLSAPALAQDESSSPWRPLKQTSSTPIDPSENVKALSEAANKRQDDLRLAENKLTTSKLEALEKEVTLLANHNRDLREASIARVDSEAKLRADYTDRLLVAEAKRIDAIRAVDVNAVAVASTRATDQATVLATQVTQSAETLRALVATTAATVAASQQQLANTLSARLTTLEQGSYQQAGKQTFSDPAFLDLIKEVRNLAAARTASAGVDTGRGDVVGWIVGGLGLLIVLGGFLLNLSSKVAARKQP